MPTTDQTLDHLRRLLAEAHGLCGRAQTPILGGEGSDDDVSFTFRGPLSKAIRKWLERAEAAVRGAQTRGDFMGGASNVDLLVQLRCLIDTANVAILRGTRSRHAWSEFCSATYRAEHCAASMSLRQGQSNVAG